LISHYHLGPHVRQPHFPACIVRHESKESVKTKGSMREKFFGEKKIVTSNRRELTYTPLGGSLWEGEGNGIYRNATIPVTIPGSIPGIMGSHIPEFHVLGRGPDQLNRYEVATKNSLLTCSHHCSHISWYNTIGFLLPCGCS